MNEGLGPLCVIWPLVFVLCVVGAEGASISGDPSCPCIGRSIYEHQQASLGAIGTQCLYATAYTTKTLFCYPTDYGANFCKAWDTELPPNCNSSDPPAHCSDPWCFVSPTNCAVSFKRSKLFAMPAYISYATCGSPDREAEYFLQDAFRGSTIRIGFPTFEKPYLFNVTKGPITTKDGMALNGAMVDLVLDVLKAAGISYTVDSISPISRALYPLSSYTACVHTVGMGLLDLCIGAFWETSQRHALAPMGNMIFADYIVLLSTPVQKGQDFWDLVARVYRPFTWQLWLMCIGVTGMFGLLIWLNERPQRLSLSESIWLSLTVFCPNAESYEPTSGGHILLFAIGVFVTITLSTYTAELASFLVVEKSVEAKLQDLASVVQTSSILCILQALEQQILLIEPRLAGYLRLYPDTVSLVEGLKAGDCSAALISSVHAKRAIAGAFGTCALVASVTPIMSLSNALPMNEVLIPNFGYWQQKTLESKPWTNYIMEFQEGTLCKASTADANPEAVGITEMLGLWLLILLLLLLWGVQQIVKRLKKWKKWTTVKNQKRERDCPTLPQELSKLPMEDQSPCVPQSFPLKTSPKLSPEAVENWLSPDLLIPYQLQAWPIHSNTPHCMESNPPVPRYPDVVM